MVTQPFTRVTQPVTLSPVIMVTLPKLCCWSYDSGQIWVNRVFHFLCCIFIVLNHALEAGIGKHVIG